MLGLRSYLDDSGSDDGSPLVTCGGPVMSRIQFKAFSEYWDKMYKGFVRKYRIDPPLHMCDFVGTGKYASLRPEFKRAIFLEVSRLINTHKLYSISIAVSQKDYAEELSKDVRKNLIGPYAFAFFSLVAANQTLSQQVKSGPLKISYLVDTGFGHYEQLVEAHALVVALEKKTDGFRHTGALATDSDDHVAALQAADVIAWTSRKIQVDGKLPEGIEPLNEVLRQDFTLPHVTIQIPREGIKMLAAPINSWISKNGDVPKLADVIKQNLGDLPRAKTKP